MLHFDGSESRLDRALMSDDYIARQGNPPPPVQPRPGNCIDAAAEDRDGMRPFFASLPAGQLLESALLLYYDAGRLRRELDDAQGVIR